ncbi:uncharacterized protein BDZ99DRAFT_574752 [Mytilinidion resinicola]|uniref:Zn(2)-C6 fungal-type domain-containing protein n=1 Tax=Mytilinidion resinicola TaxID=574789 RepID=A0A6A6Y8I2_9PEZI|nr:uncharacterized protein BDZ99DRAFT_574752 [Mytilinidion resinicola]KAF2805141.1 hypothetical protein BDZ99DRAFT_574752 [Mytilinidion resinicola]
MSLGSPNISFFHVSAQRLDGSGPDLQDVYGRSCRQRRRHAKSKRGCAGCKRRRCDEALPACHNCLRRGESCNLPENQQPSPRTPPSQSDEFLGLTQEVNLYQMKLFHTFGTRTARTLIFGEHLWRNGIMRQCFTHDYLMHAILLISATHLHSLEPHDPRNYNASVVHLSKTLQLFRKALSGPVTHDNADALMATAILLYHHAWTNLDSFTPSTPVSDIDGQYPKQPLNLSTDPIFTLSAGLKEIFDKAKHLLTRDGSAWLATAHSRAHLPIVEAARRCSKAPEYFEEYLKRYFQGIENPLSSTNAIAGVSSNRSLIEKLLLSANTDEAAGWFDLIRLSEPTENTSVADREILTAYMTASCRLAPLLSMCKPPKPDTRLLIVRDPEGAHNLSTKPMHDGLYSSVALYLFSFPIRSDAVFNAMVRRNDCRAYMVLLYFYRGVKALLSAETYWWCRARADFMERALHASLRDTGLGKIIDAEEHAFNAGQVTWARNTDKEGRKAGSPCFFQNLWTEHGGCVNCMPNYTAPTI